MGKIVASIISILFVLIIAVSLIPGIPLDVKVRVIVYAGIPLALITGGSAVAFIQNMLVRVFMGAVTFAVIIGLLESLPE